MGLESVSTRSHTSTRQDLIVEAADISRLQAAANRLTMGALAMEAGPTRKRMVSRVDVCLLFACWTTIRLQ